jgi:hypothetical protein
MSTSRSLCLSMAAALFLGACASGDRETWAKEPPVVRRLAELESTLKSDVARSGRAELLDLAEQGAAPLWLVRFDPPGATRRLLVCAGIHGDEPAGVLWALELIGELCGPEGPPPGVAVDVVPVINAWGWERDVRYDADGRDVNRDFARFRTPEARALRRLFAERRYDLAVDHHEDSSASGLYLYEYAPRSREPARAALSAARSQGYPLEQNVSFVILRTRDGLIHAPLWGLWYMRLTGKLSATNYLRLRGDRAVYTVETPARLPPEERVRMHRRMLEALAAATAGGADGK